MRLQRRQIVLQHLGQAGPVAGLAAAVGPGARCSLNSTPPPGPGPWAEAGAARPSAATAAAQRATAGGLHADPSPDLCCGEDSMAARRFNASDAGPQGANPLDCAKHESHGEASRCSRPSWSPPAFWPSSPPASPRPRRPRPCRSPACPRLPGRFPTISMARRSPRSRRGWSSPPSKPRPPSATPSPPSPSSSRPAPWSIISRPPTPSTRWRRWPCARPSRLRATGARPATTWSATRRASPASPTAEEIFPFAGGEPIFFQGKVVGAIGVTGTANADEAVAHAGALALDGKAPDGK